MTLGVIAFVVALLVSIMLHEAGHFATAKRFGMKAPQFFVGFGPTIWSFRRGETEYGIKAIPAGGFVKITGMTPLEEVEPGDEDRAFYKQPAWQRTIVLAAGSFMHFVIAFALLFAVLAVIGTPKLVPTVNTVSACVPAKLTTQPTAQVCSALPPSPAKAAGLQHGDEIVAFDGQPIKDWDALTAKLQKHGPGPATLTIVRDGQRSVRTVDLVPAERPSETNPKVMQTVGALGVTATEVADRMDPLAAVTHAGTGFGRLTTATFGALGNLPHAVGNLFHATVDGGQRSSDGLVGPVGIARVSGEALAQGGTPLFDRIGTFVLLIAGVNVFVGIFNLLPLLPLDGGHLAVLGYEEGRRRLYRLVGRRDPGRVDLTKLLPAAYLVMVLFIGLSVLLLLGDIVNPIANPFTG